MSGSTGAPGSPARGHSRRDFLRGTGRCVALGVLVLGTARLVARRGSGASSCPGLSPCDACPRLARCALPEADAERLLATRRREPHDS